MTPFQTPLVEVSFEVDSARDVPLEFRAFSFYGPIAAEFPQVEWMPIVLVPPNEGAQLPYPAAVRFYSEDRSHLVQLGPRMLAINQIIGVRPWSGYAEYRAFATRMLERYMDVWT